MYLHTLHNEKTTAIMWRRHGYSINTIAKVLGRSTSWIHSTLEKARAYKILRKISNRKLPNKVRLINARKRLFQLFSWLKLWQPFILGEEDQPP